MTDFERFQEYGRIRQIAKDVDEYSLTMERDKHLYVALSSGQVVPADKFHHQTDIQVFTWLKLLLNIRGIKLNA